jgi:perosamine synthetase
MYKIPLSKPSYLPYIDEVLSATEKVLRSGFIAQGEKVEQFEQMIADYTGCKYAIAVSSGTAGLFLCLKAIGIGRGDEVITSPYSFIASSNVIVHAGATPLFVDIDRETYNIDVKKAYNKKYVGQLYYNRPIKAILPADIFGLPVDTFKLSDGRIKNKHYNHTKIILDSCESFGSKIDRPFDAQVFAFYPNKQLCTGEGACIVTNNKDIAEYCQAMRNQGRKKGDKWLDSTYIGYNYRMTDLQAAIGIVQLNHWNEIKLKRQHAALEYTIELGDLFLSGMINQQSFTVPDVCPFVYTIEVDNRDKVMQYLLDHDIECKPYFPAIHTQKPYLEMGYKHGDYPIAELVSSRTLAIPFYTGMPENEIDEVCKCLKSAIKEC